jgi:hypothetical protein
MFSLTSLEDLPRGGRNLPFGGFHGEADVVRTRSTVQPGKQRLLLLGSICPGTRPIAVASVWATRPWQDRKYWLVRDETFHARMLPLSAQASPENRPTLRHSLTR